MNIQYNHELLTTYRNNPHKFFIPFTLYEDAHRDRGRLLEAMETIKEMLESVNQARCPGTVPAIPTALTFINNFLGDRLPPEPKPDPSPEITEGDVNGAVNAFKAAMMRVSFTEDFELKTLLRAVLEDYTRVHARSLSGGNFVEVIHNGRVISRVPLSNEIKSGDTVNLSYTMNYK